MSDLLDLGGGFLATNSHFCVSVCAQRMYFLLLKSPLDDICVSNCLTSSLNIFWDCLEQKPVLATRVGFRETHFAIVLGQFKASTSMSFKFLFLPPSKEKKTAELGCAALLEGEGF